VWNNGNVFADRNLSVKSEYLLVKDNVIPIKDDTALKTEPRIKREMGYILCKVHMCGNGQS